jgi:hypothetical protein
MYESSVEEVTIVTRDLVARAGNDEGSLAVMVQFPASLKRLHITYNRSSPFPSNTILDHSPYFTVGSEGNISATFILHMILQVHRPVGERVKVTITGNPVAIGCGSDDAGLNVEDLGGSPFCRRLRERYYSELKKKGLTEEEAAKRMKELVIVSR